MYLCIIYGNISINFIMLKINLKTKINEDYRKLQL